MKELLILSGKGGTGKTSITGALAMLLPQAVLADCDVDAADLHLLLSPQIREEHEFRSGVLAVIDPALCNACGTCVELCRFRAIQINTKAELRPFSCEGCGVCARFCPQEAISLQEKHCGAWFVSETEYGPMIHARLGIGEENSGKLVSLVKKKAREEAEAKKAAWLLVDGPPGIACPVIASLSGVDLVLLVTEPTLSGLHDLKRVAELVRHFKVPLGVCINKWDLHPGYSADITRVCREQAIPVLGTIPFDKAVVDAVVNSVPLLRQAPKSAAAKAVRGLYEKIIQLSLSTPTGKKSHTLTFRTGGIA